MLHVSVSNIGKEKLKIEYYHLIERSYLVKHPFITYIVGMDFLWTKILLRNNCLKAINFLYICVHLTPDCFNYIGRQIFTVVLFIGEAEYIRLFIFVCSWLCRKNPFKAEL